MEKPHVGHGSPLIVPQLTQKRLRTFGVPQVAQVQAPPPRSDKLDIAQVAPAQAGVPWTWHFRLRTANPPDELTIRSRVSGMRIALNFQAPQRLYATKRDLQISMSAARDLV